jgi:YD repeat-containing protein
MAKIQYLPASPNAASLGKYSDIPINYNTGIPNISIPVYDIKECDITLPISLSYHAGGIRVQEEASMVGLGWSLNAGGVINRSTRGMADEGWQGFFTTHQTIKDLISNAINGDEARDKKIMIMSGTLDSEPDLFSCNVGGISIKFSMDLDGNFVTFPVSNYKIQYNENPNKKEWKITDDKGNEYYFGGHSDGISLSETAVKTSDTEYPSAWFINRIIPYACNLIPNKITTEKMIRFYYVSNRQSSIISYLENDYRIASLPNSAGGFFSIPLSAMQENSLLHQTPYLKKITWSAGEVSFSIDKNRLDNNSLYQLNGLTVFGMTSVARSCTFTYVFDGRMKLSSLTIGPAADIFHEYTNETIKPQRYFFEYSPDLSANANSRAQDHWGYYNGSSPTQSLIPSFKLENPVAQGLQTYTTSSIREVNPLFSRDGCLKRIVYPTGGSTEFEFESNTQRNYDMNTTLVDQPRDVKGDFYSGGLRVSKITSHDPFHPQKDKVIIFNYDDADGHTSGHIEDMPIYAFVQDRLIIDRISVGLGGVSSISEDADYVVMKQASQFNLANKNNTTYYSKVTVLQGADGADGKDEYYYATALLNLSQEQKDLPFAAVWNQDWKNELLKEVHYKWELSDFKKISESIYFHSSIRLNNNVKGYKVGVKKLVQHYAEGEFNFESPQAQQFIAATEDFYSDYDYLANAVTKIYSSSDPATYTTTQVFYEVDPVSLYNRSTKTTNSAGQEEVVTRRYSTDYFTDTQPVYFDAYGAGVYYQENPKVFGLVVEEFRTINDKVVNGAITLYDPVLPLRVSTLQFESRMAIPKLNVYVESHLEKGRLVIDPHYKQRIEYTFYDEDGNVTIEKIKDGHATGVLWDYNNELPVAEVKMGNPDRDIEIQTLYIGGYIKNIAVTPNFAYTSFEGTNFGGWQGVNALGVQSGDYIPTGTKVYNLSSGALSYQFLRSAKYYLYVWTNGSVPSIDAFEGFSTTPEVITSGRGGWQLLRYKVNSHTVTLTGSCLIDEIKIFPEETRMTTSTYSPGIGVQSTSDADGKIVYYNYDHLARLISIIDMKGNILKTIDYQFQK